MKAVKCKCNCLINVNPLKEQSEAFLYFSLLFSTSKGPPLATQITGVPAYIASSGTIPKCSLQDFNTIVYLSIKESSGKYYHWELCYSIVSTWEGVIIIPIL